MWSPPPHPPPPSAFCLIRDNMTIYIPDNLCPLNVFILALLIYGTLDCMKEICRVVSIILKHNHDPTGKLKNIMGWWVHSSVTLCPILNLISKIIISGFSLNCSLVINIGVNFSFVRVPVNQRHDEDCPNFYWGKQKKRVRRFSAPRLGFWKAVS